MNNSTGPFQEFIIVDNGVNIIIASIIVLIGGHLALKYIFKKCKIKEANALSIIGSVVIFLTFVTLYYASQKDSGMVTATVTIILVVITGYYAWNTHLQVESMGDQARLTRAQIEEMRKQNNTINKQFTLMDKNIKYERITKEMNLLILPLMTIIREIESIGIDENWWALQHKSVTETNPTRGDKFRNAVDSVDQNKYLAPRNLYPLIDDFIVQLRNMKKNSQIHRELLKGATNNLYYNNGDLAEKRYQYLTIELQTLDSGEGDSLGDK